MSDMIQLLWHLITGDADPAEKSIGMKFLIRTSYRLAITLSVVWGLGWLGTVGMGAGYARADAVQLRIESLNAPLVRKTDELQTSFERLASLVNDQLANSTAGEIRIAFTKRCNKTLPDEERDRAQREIDRKQEEYFALRKRYYQFSCSDL